MYFSISVIRYFCHFCEMEEDNKRAIFDYTFEEYHELSDYEADRLTQLTTDDEWSTWCEKYKLEWEELEKTELENLKKETRVLYFKLFRAIIAVLIFVILLIWWGNTNSK